MSLFDILFPEQAQAEHLRTLAETSRRQLAMQSSRQYSEEMERRKVIRLNSKTDDRVAELELEVAQSALVIEALLTLLEEKNLITREELRERSAQIDAADGVVDGRITPTQDKPFVPKREWPVRTSAQPPSISPARPPGGSGSGPRSH
jgi:hypothetical protein